jgi:hypothetical protein
MNKADATLMNLIAGKTKLYLNNGVQSETMSFADFGYDFGSEDIFTALADRGVRMSIIGFVVFLWFMGSSIKAVYSIAVLALIGNIINMALTRIPIRFSGMLKLSAYARTLPLVMSWVIPLVVGFEFSPIVFYAVGAFYVYMGLKNIKAQNGIVIADISDTEDKE